jgi:hypothetical protein
MCLLFHIDATVTVTGADALLVVWSKLQMKVQAWGRTVVVSKRRHALVHWGLRIAT